jgi:nicotinamide riboside transporter PnuC
MITSVLVYIATTLGIAGSILNIYRHYACFILWEIANVLLFVYNLSIKEYCQACLFLVYGVITGWGLVKWLREGKSR